MAFQAITTQEIATGGPIQNPTLAKIQNDLSLHDSEITTLQASILNPEPLTFEMKGGYWTFSLPLTGQAYKRVWANITLSGGFVWIPKAGTAGTTQIDVQYQPFGGSFSTIFSTKPSAAFGSGDGFISSNGVLTGGVPLAITSGGIIRIDVVTAQTGSPEFHILLPYTFT